MKRLYPLLLMLVVIAMLGKTTITAFAPDLKYSAVVSSDWSEESEDDDEMGDDDQVFESVGDLIAVTLSSVSPSVPLSLRLETMPREILAPPPQS